ncbi:hypothetical protein MLD38_021139 [Melastoma candidum]|uniref:Uncharacterized protein n=1 Tax=Melastoma candidum TaxID=119954 RepID=A0ACB9QFM2_9MYRT|nr:hypothetical protein MLD38_021139 [Melastoma candidum]
MVKTANSGANSLKEYLKRYESNAEEETKTKKKKKKKPREGAIGEGGRHSGAAGVLVVDEDPVWQKPVKLVEEEEDSADEEQPQVDEDIEVKRMRRLELIKSKRPFHSIADDGSGWVSLSPKRSGLNGATDDLSPPRVSKTWNDTPSPKPARPSDHDNGDASPPRRRQRQRDTPSPEPSAMSDMSPPRRRRMHSEEPSSDPNPKYRRDRKRPIPSDDDISPPRNRRIRHDTPPLEQNRDTKSLSKGYSDLSPPRQQRRPVLSDDRTLDLSPPRRSNSRGLHNEGKSGRDVDSDLSPPRKDHHGSYHKDGGHISDLSPPRKSRGSGAEPIPPDLSPPRKSRKNLSVESGNRPKTGLISGQEISKELTRIKKDEQSRFQAMDSSLTGKGAEPVYRDKITGRRMSKEEQLEKQKKVEEKPKEIKLEWGKGLAQKRAAEESMGELELEKDKPFARTRDDPDLDAMLKDRIRWGDPMAHLVKKKNLETMLRDFGDSERMKESGFVIPQDIPNHSWLKRGLDATPNRYGIRPGRHWDGVDRSNGYEKELFKRTNEKRASEKEAYLWSVSDM